MNDVPYCSAWRDQSTVYQPRQALAQAWGMCSSPRGQCQTGIYMEQVAEAPETPSPSPHSQAARSCTFPTAAVTFSKWSITSCLWEPESASCKLCLVPKQTLQCWVAVCCLAARSTHLPLSGGLTHLWTNCYLLILGDDPEFLRAKTTPKQKRQCDFRVDAYPGHCFSMLAPQGPQFSSCTLTLAPLVIVLSHTQVRPRMMFQFTTLPFLVIPQRNQCSDMSDFYWVVGLYFMLWRNTYFT